VPRLLPVLALPLLGDGILMLLSRWLGRHEPSEADVADATAG
jgi:hypothetical protein